MLSTPSAAPEAPPLLDLHPETESLREAVLDGLQREPKSIPSKFFYDERGSKLFEAICELDEYYLTDTEIGIMCDNIEAIVQALGPNVRLVEYGSGSSRKTRILLDHLPDLAGYVPIDISREHLMEAAEQLAHAYPEVPILPVCADYTSTFELPEPDRPVARTVVYYPGSTIGNFTREAARDFLQHIAEVIGPEGGLLVGVDLQKDPDVLHAAYNDTKGITAAFNKNLLWRINRELGARFDPDRFRHEALYNEGEGRIEMYLVSETDQRVTVADMEISFRAGEAICTEYSHKYTLEGFAELAASAGLSVQQVWTDEQSFFSVQYCETRSNGKA